jgi:hypothetical protein
VFVEAELFLEPHEFINKLGIWLGQSVLRHVAIKISKSSLYSPLIYLSISEFSSAITSFKSKQAILALFLSLFVYPSLLSVSGAGLKIFSKWFEVVIIMCSFRSSARMSCREEFYIHLLRSAIQTHEHHVIVLKSSET